MCTQIDPTRSLICAHQQVHRAHRLCRMQILLTSQGGAHRWATACDCCCPLAHTRSFLWCLDARNERKLTVCSNVVHGLCDSDAQSVRAEKCSYDVRQTIFGIYFVSEHKQALLFNVLCTKKKRSCPRPKTHPKSTAHKCLHIIAHRITMRKHSAQSEARIACEFMYGSEQRFAGGRANRRNEREFQ